MNLEEAIAARFQQQQDDRAATTFTPDAELERLGARLDDLKEVSRAEYEHPGLADVRRRVITYRRRKAEHERGTP